MKEYVKVLWCGSHRKLKGYDVPTFVTKSAPDFCSVYVISKGKIVSARAALRHVANTVTPPKQPLTHAESENVARCQEMNNFLVI